MHEPRQERRFVIGSVPHDIARLRDRSAKALFVCLIRLMAAFYLSLRLQIAVKGLMD